MRNYKEIQKKFSGFTLVELMVVVSIIGILLAISVFSLQKSKRSGRDAKRKSDLEMIRSGIEIYRADCRVYPLTNELVFGSSLNGTEDSGSCESANEYIKEIPNDSESPSRSYSYYSLDGISYKICASLENEPLSTPSPEDLTNCNCVTNCNYVVTSP